jgi:hypothetical protein
MKSFWMTMSWLRWHLSHFFQLGWSLERVEGFLDLAQLGSDLLVEEQAVLEPQMFVIQLEQGFLPLVQFLLVELAL